MGHHIIKRGFNHSSRRAAWSTTAAAAGPAWSMIKTKQASLKKLRGFFFLFSTRRFLRLNKVNVVVVRTCSITLYSREGMRENPSPFPFFPA